MGDSAWGLPSGGDRSTHLLHQDVVSRGLLFAWGLHLGHCGPDWLILVLIYCALLLIHIYKGSNNTILLVQILSSPLGTRLEGVELQVAFSSALLVRRNSSSISENSFISVWCHKRFGVCEEWELPRKDKILAPEKEGQGHICQQTC